MRSEHDDLKAHTKDILTEVKKREGLFSLKRKVVGHTYDRTKLQFAAKKSKRVRVVD